MGKNDPEFAICGSCTNGQKIVQRPVKLRDGTIEVQWVKEDCTECDGSGRIKKG